MSMVFPADSKINGYEAVSAAIKNSKNPFKIGYHSPTSAPRVVFEGALHKAGYTITGNPNDVDILMVDLKSTANLIPALLSHQVDCWVEPAPHPAVAEYKHVGHIGLSSRDLPPKGQWTDFPCCVMGASEQMIAEQPEVVQAMTDLMTLAARWSNTHKLEAAKISADWIDVPKEAVEKSTIIYTTDPTENWMTILPNTENFWDGFGSNFSTVDSKQYAVFLLIPVLAPIFLILLWLVLASRIDNQVILPGVWEVGTLLFHPTQDMIGMGSLAGNVLVSLVRVVMGYSIAAAIAVPLGVVMGY